jgi:hypothetical protein
MQMMSPVEKYSLREIARELNLPTIVEHGIRDNFGDPISINELKQISRHRFLSIKNFGYKRWREFQNALAMFDPSDRSVSLINWGSSNNLVVEIDLSKPFVKVIEDLYKIVKRFG